MLRRSDEFMRRRLYDTLNSPHIKSEGTDMKKLKDTMSRSMAPSAPPPSRASRATARACRVAEATELRSLVAAEDRRDVPIRPQPRSDDSSVPVPQ